MKTILVVYSNLPFDKIKYEKRYAFNTESDLKAGDKIKSPSYDTPMQVVKVLDEVYKYFNKDTGDFANDYNNSKLYEIRLLNIIADTENAITAVKI